jgi:hypothetical protein
MTYIIFGLSTEEQGNRYSTICSKHGCIESRDIRLRDARKCKKKHMKLCGAQVSIYHWHINNESKPKGTYPKSRIVE